MTLKSEQPPRVSVVMSVYNSESLLQESIESILIQTFSDWELIIVNDGSTDTSSRILNEYSSRESRVHVIEQSNTGLTRALVRGCQVARGEFIMRQDGDDHSHPDRLARQLLFLETHPEVGFVGCATRYIGPNGELLELVTRDPDPQVASRKLRDERCGPPAHGGVMFRRELYETVGGYRAAFYLGQDSDLWLRMIEHAEFGCISEESYFFRRHAASVSSRHRDEQRAFGLLSHDCRKARAEGQSEMPFLIEAQNLSEQVRERRLRGVIVEQDMELNYLIGSRLALDRQPNAARYLWPVVKKQPWHWKAWVRLMQSCIFRPSQKSTEADSE